MDISALLSMIGGMGGGRMFGGGSSSFREGPIAIGQNPSTQPMQVPSISDSVATQPMLSQTATPVGSSGGGFLQQLMGMISGRGTGSGTPMSSAPAGGMMYTGGSSTFNENPSAIPTPRAGGMAQLMQMLRGTQRL